MSKFEIIWKNMQKLRLLQIVDKPIEIRNIIFNFLLLLQIESYKSIHLFQALTKYNNQYLYHLIQELYPIYLQYQNKDIPQQLDLCTTTFCR